MQNIADWLVMKDILVARQVGQVVRETRRKLGLTQAELARRAGVSTRLVSGLELGDNAGVQLDKLLPILHVLGLAMTIYDGAITDDEDEAEVTSVAESEGTPQEEASDVDPIAHLTDRYQAMFEQMKARAMNNKEEGYGDKKP